MHTEACVGRICRGGYVRGSVDKWQAEVAKVKIGTVNVTRVVVRHMSCEGVQNTGLAYAGLAAQEEGVGMATGLHEGGSLSKGYFHDVSVWLVEVGGG